MKYNINLNFEEINLPPFRDILIVGKNSPQGKIGLSKSFELLIPDQFQLFEIEENEKVEMVFINRRILNKISWEKVLTVLQEKVFPYVSQWEIIKVDFKVNVMFENVELE